MTKVYVASAFCKDKKGGNKAGVVFDDNILSDDDKKNIAKQLGYAETAFISKSDKADYCIRYFTPAEEVPLCGHATIASFGVLQHKFVLLQDGAAAIIINEEGKILLQSRADRELWGLPGGCQELGESFKDAVIREVKEETNLDVEEKDLELIDIVSGNSRRNSYPNGDVVINNTALYCIRRYSGELKWDEESKEMKFFDLDNLPENQNDPDLIQIYREYEKRKQKDFEK